MAYRLLEQASAPSWRYMVDQGATTIWERWDGWTAERGFQSAWMNSFNHYALGSAFPGAPGAQEAVFEVGSGSYEFSGPALPEEDHA